MQPSKMVVERDAPLSLLTGDAAVQRAVVQMRAWAQKLAAAEQQAEAEDDEAWARAVPAEREADKPRSRPALLGTVVLVLAVLCGVTLASLRQR
ncbi:hypothetical protein ACMHYB_14960 [Sorangium sp. So ce1128]